MNLIDAVGKEWLAKHVTEALAEDLGDRGDITCKATIPLETTGYAELCAKSDGVLAGSDWAVMTGQLSDPQAIWRFLVEDGSKVKAGDIVAEVSGSMHGILISERTAINGLAHLSGVATMAARAVELVKGTNAKVLDTRKTSPGWRLAEKYAVLAGGAANHRVGLYDEVLIKENHIEASGSTAQAIIDSQDWIKNNYPDIKIPVEVEVESLEQLEEALSASPDRVLLDNFNLEDLKKAVKLNNNQCKLEASGGITLNNIAEIASSGVDRISLGALTHSVIPLDLSLLVKKA